ncbi:carbohydrate-binding module family 18 protein [Aplosporella prunicola CBS 121167]|uniref:Carbohydrate-binding module family 18 protein n=1 Tax=Aplosporella prunicola CBS 121167 TaxID=1176127 RepID=A0A6A6AUH0_9PEZI|nr:carbohydrate-binding module family 18 protein [Aplosporella prunicola CBS 121167]KAF2135246.1 carbohydrate-binding module family 18 protein [Aplosporella prunicola CBS 121167]
MQMPNKVVTAILLALFCGVAECSPAGNGHDWLPRAESSLSTAASSVVTRTAATTPMSTPTSAGMSPNGQCGGTTGLTCKGSGYGECCSSLGWCGDEKAYCYSSFGCQSKFGECTTTTLTPDGTCGGDKGYTCTGLYSPGNKACCSVDGFCGSSGIHCGTGCQPEFGDCAAADVTMDGTCGGDQGLTCAGSAFGACCSALGHCGDTANWCGQGCQKEFSSGCLTVNVPSVDGSCGATNGGFTCTGILGNFNGDCCSDDGWCGSTSEYCGTGCQSGFGRCE